MFVKQYNHVLRAIENIECPQVFREPNFGLAEYIDAQGKPRPMYEMTRDFGGCR
jgi:phage regulator Rha-like protein